MKDSDIDGRHIDYSRLTYWQVQILGGEIMDDHNVFKKS